MAQQKPAEAAKPEAAKAREDKLNQDKIDNYSKQWDAIKLLKKGEKADVPYTDLDASIDFLRQYYRGHAATGAGLVGKTLSFFQRYITLNANRHHVAQTQDVIIKATEKDSKITSVTQLLTELKDAIIKDKAGINPEGSLAHYVYVIQQKAKVDVINVKAINDAIEQANKDKAAEAAKPAAPAPAPAAAAAADAAKPAAETQKAASSYWGSFTYGLSYLNPLAYGKKVEKEPVFVQADRKFGC